MGGLPVESAQIPGYGWFNRPAWAGQPPESLGGSEGGAASHGQPQAGPTTHGQVGGKGQPAMAKAPYKGAGGHGQNPLAGAATSRRGRRRAWLAPIAEGGGCPLQGRKRQPRGQDCRLQGAARRPGLPPARAAAGRRDRLQGQHPREAAPPACEVPPEGNSACAGQQRRRWGQEGLWLFLEKKMILPL
ncbi:hypothetical protein BHM03_00021609 [Ensete ventricosum]|nr:hypothetical protein BHM03_00021609 [Ensete ventricosum]